MWLKTAFDYVFALLILPILFPIIVFLVIISTWDTAQFGLFSQRRIGKNARHFQIYKIRTMKGISKDPITTENSHQITRIGKILRQTKLDELPQIFNILLGQMSFVGPRPDVPGYADQLKGEDRLILKMKPGITGPAQLAFKNEEAILNQQDNPIQYNDQVIWPKKVAINKAYVQHWTFKKDLIYMLQTIGLFKTYLS